ncbi:MAG TPA: cytochrome c oxidase subunit 3 [Dongiaceae bacterium]|nr:cytochrome c oxidase subunit 3 [Dongiaceae bacterium]
MPGTSVLDDIELIIEDIGGGHGGQPPARDDGGNEGDSGNGRPERGRRGARKIAAAVGLLMVSILVLFLTLAAAFVFLRIHPLRPWTSLRLPGILWLNTLVLVASSATLEVARRKLYWGEPRAFNRWWALTTLLGAAFVAGQVAAWGELTAGGVNWGSQMAGWFFYVFTALHAAHILGGLLALLYVQFRRFDAASPARAAAADVASYYWHFMDGLWVFLFALLYLGR